MVTLQVPNLINFVADKGQPSNAPSLQVSEATKSYKQIGLLRCGACHRVSLCTDPLASLRKRFAFVEAMTEQTATQRKSNGE